MFVIERVAGLQIEDEHGNAGALHHGQHLGRCGVGADVAENQVEAGACEEVTRIDGRRSGVHQTGGYDLHAEGGGLGFDEALIAFEAWLESWELLPVCGEADAEDSDTPLVNGFTHPDRSIACGRGVVFTAETQRR